MLEPPARSHSASSSNEAGNMLIDRDLPEFEISRGHYKPVDCVYVAQPMPHTSELTNQPINPLLCDTLLPSTYTPGVRVSFCTWPGVKNRRKPRNNLLRNKSSYVSRVTQYERFTRLTKMNQEFEAIWVSVGRSMQLLPLTSVKSDPLFRVMFTKAWPLCHVTGPGTEVVCGMSSGDLVWMDAASGKYTRLNKAGNLTRASVTAIAWVDALQTQVIAGHADGSLVIYDLEREDGPDAVFQPTGPNVLLQMYMSQSPSQNPVLAIKISNTPVTDLCVLQNQVVCTSRDGYMRCLNLSAMSVGQIIHSNFGGLFSVAFSNDHKYMAIAGEDDVVYLYIYETMQLVCNLVGHRSWIRKVAFEPFDDGCALYRLASVGEDGQYLMWEFDSQSLLGTNNMYPTAAVCPSLPKISQAPLTDLFFGPSTVSAVGCNGRIWTWEKPGRPTKDAS